MELEEGDIVLCTVDKIDKTIVFVKIDGSGEGSIILSEIAPGRIRNLRDYVVPKKKIVCKVLRIKGGNIELSLRRVTQKERKELLNEYKQEQSYLSILKSILGDDTNKIISEINKEQRIYNFLQKAKKDSGELERLVGKEKAKKILEILNIQKQKRAILKKEINLKSDKSNGLEIIRKIMDIKNAEIRYISAGRYSIKVEDNEIKKADNMLKEIIKEIEKRAKKEGAEFKIIEK